MSKVVLENYHIYFVEFDILFHDNPEISINSLESALTSVCDSFQTYNVL